MRFVLNLLSWIAWFVHDVSQEGSTPLAMASEGHTLADRRAVVPVYQADSAEWRAQCWPFGVDLYPREIRVGSTVGYLTRTPRTPNLGDGWITLSLADELEPAGAHETAVAVHDVAALDLLDAIDAGNDDWLIIDSAHVFEAPYEAHAMEALECFGGGHLTWCECTECNHEVVAHGEVGTYYPDETAPLHRAEVFALIEEQALERMAEANAAIDAGKAELASTLDAANDVTQHLWDTYEAQVDPDCDCDECEGLRI